MLSVCSLTENNLENQWLWMVDYTIPSIITIVNGATVKQRIISVVSTLINGGTTDQCTRATKTTGSSISSIEWARRIDVKK